MRLTDADALRDLFQSLADDDWNQGAPTTWAEAYGAVAELVADVPTIDAAPIRRGKWQITEAYPHNVYCSECHKKFAQTHWAVWEDGSIPRNFCPHCGARMDVEVAEE